MDRIPSPDSNAPVERMTSPEDEVRSTGSGTGSNAKEAVSRSGSNASSNPPTGRVTRIASDPAQVNAFVATDSASSSSSGGGKKRNRASRASNFSSAISNKFKNKLERSKSLSSLANEASATVRTTLKRSFTSMGTVRIRSSTTSMAAAGMGVRPVGLVNPDHPLQDVDYEDYLAQPKDLAGKTMGSILFDDVVNAKNRQHNAEIQADIRFLIMPWSHFLTFWRTMMVFMVLFAVILAPFEIAFSWWTPSLTVSVLSRLVDIFCILDMVMNLFIVPIKFGRLVTKRRKITWMYVKSWFLMDLIINMPWDLVVSEGSSKQSRKIIKTLKLPKVFRLTRLFRVAREEAHTLGTVFTISGMLLLAHYFSCLWVVMLIDCDTGQKCPNIVDTYTEGLSVGMATLSGSDAWMRFSIEGSKYSTTDSDFNWRSPPGVGVELVAMSTCLIGFCMLGMLFGNIAHAMDKQDNHTRHFNERLANVKAVTKQHALSKDIYSRARRHFHFVWSCGSDSSRDLLADQALSVDLRRELAFSFYGDLLRKVPFLQNAEENLLKQICKNAKMEVFSPQDNIIMAGEFGTELFFLVSGSVVVRNPQDDACLRTLEEGSFFGEVALFFPEHGHSVNVQASSFGWLLVVDRDCITQVCSEELLEAFRNVAMERAEFEFTSLGYLSDTDSFDKQASAGSAHTAPSTVSQSSLPSSQGLSMGLGSHAVPRHPMTESRGVSIVPDSRSAQTPSPPNGARRGSVAVSRASVRHGDGGIHELHEGRDSLASVRRHVQNKAASLPDAELYDFANRMEAKIDAWAGALEQRLVTLDSPKGAAGPAAARGLQADSSVQPHGGGKLSVDLDPIDDNISMTPSEKADELCIY